MVLQSWSPISFPFLHPHFASSSSPVHPSLCFIFHNGQHYFFGHNDMKRNSRFLCIASTFPFPVPNSSPLRFILFGPVQFALNSWFQPTTIQLLVKGFPEFFTPIGLILYSRPQFELNVQFPVKEISVSAPCSKPSREKTTHFPAYNHTNKPYRRRW